MNRALAFLAGSVVCSALSLGTAHAQLTKAQLNAYNNIHVTTNGVGGITGANLNLDIGQIITAMCGTAQTADCVLPTLGSLDIGVGTSASGRFISAVVTSGGVFGVPAFYFNDVSNPTGTTDTATHFAMGIVGNSPAGGTGSYEGLFVQQFGTGRDNAGYITAFQATAQDESGGTGGGNFGGSNPQCLNNYITMTSCVGEEIDISTAFAPSNIRDGLLIADLGSAAGTYGVGSSDAAIAVVAAVGAAGFKYGLSFGESNTGSLPPIASGGTYINTGTSSVSHAAGLDTRGTPNWSVAPVITAYGVAIGTENFAGNGQIALIGSTGTGNIICVGCNGAFPTQFGGTVAIDGNELAIAKGTASGSGPGAGFLDMQVAAGTNSGSCKIIAYAGTSGTPVTVVDNVGAGC